jgi:uncharacterized protein (DUF2249 family)
MWEGVFPAMNQHQDLLKMFKERTGGKTMIEIKDHEPAAPYQTSRIQDYQMTGGGK